ncbi:Hpt domain-containing protein [Shewanella litorisediminis]|uniref:Hpt domain-containing protein n=1 Tax=Shewanella litorisediminis TaxID=1173586 RepID=A0ABX7G6F8_9GAMM|nr:Hpt domain-containing protein [Shewanella litorisediminis]MCL2917729.1 Hpt domain-containing protein [Shewanella litorisediminis]QRH02848.1 Hpt domain-containing protein [Shewanella litorisediminis]
MSEIYVSWLNNVEEDAEEFIQVYIESVTEDLELINHSMRVPDTDLTLNVLHRLKGGLSVIGFNYMHDLVESALISGRNQHASYKDQLNILISELQYSLNCLTKLKLAS